MELDEIDGTIAELEAEIEGARSELGEVRRALESGLATSDRTMRTALRCPACTKRQLLHVTKILDRAEGFTRPGMALHQPRRWRQAGVGQFEAWVCTACGLVEWYVTGLEKISVHGDSLRFLEDEAHDKS